MCTIIRAHTHEQFSQMTVDFKLRFVCKGLEFCVFSVLAYTFVLVLFAFVVRCSYFSAMPRSTGKNVSEMTCFVSSGT